MGQALIAVRYKSGSGDSFPVVSSPFYNDDRLTAGKFFRYFSARISYHWALSVEKSKSERSELRPGQRDPAFLRANRKRYDAGLELRTAWDAACVRQEARSAERTEAFWQEMQLVNARSAEKKAAKAERKAAKKAEGEQAKRQPTFQPVPDPGPVPRSHEHPGWEPPDDWDQPIYGDEMPSRENEHDVLDTTDTGSRYSPIGRSGKSPATHIYRFGSERPPVEAAVPKGLKRKPARVTFKDFEVSDVLFQKLQALDAKVASNEQSGIGF